MLIRLAPSQEGKSLSGAVMGGGSCPELSVFATGVPSAFGVNSEPPVTVPQFEGALPGRSVIVQQVTKPRTKIKLPAARISPTTIMMTCITEGRFSLMFLKKFILFIQVLYIP